MMLNITKNCFFNSFTTVRRTFFNFLQNENKMSFKIDARGQPKAVVIFLHGLGDSGAGWMEGFREIRDPDVSYIFPNAPNIPVTLNFGMQMPAWFDIKALEFDGEEDKQGIQKSSNFTKDLVKEQMEKYKLPSEKIILGGFSQGGAIALYAGMTHAEKLGGILALSTWLPLHKMFVDKKEGHSLTQQSCKVLQYHGDADPMVKLKYGRLTNQLLESNQRDVTMKVYNGMEHSSCPQEMKDIKNAISELIN